MTTSVRYRTFALACAAFFFRFAALGAFGPYIALWLRECGQPTLLLGMLYSTYRFVGFLSPMLLGALADARRCHAELFIAGCLLNAISVFCMTLERSAGVQAVCLVLAALSDPSALLDAMVVRCLTWAGASADAPKSRAFGALAWVCVAPMYGALKPVVGLSSLFRIYVPLQLLPVGVVLLLPVERAYADARPEADHRDGSTVDATSDSLHGRLRLISRSRRWRALGLLSLIFMCGVHFGVAFGYGFLFFVEELHATGLQLGLTLTAQALLEVPLFQIAGRLVKSMGMRTSLLTCMLAAAIRFWGYVSVSSVWWVLPFEANHGWAFAIYYTAAAMLAEEFTSDGLQATMLGVANSAQQLGSLVATLGWSGLISAIGMRAAFSAAAMVFTAATVPLLFELPAAFARGSNARRVCHRCLRGQGSRLLERGVERSSTTTLSPSRPSGPSGPAATLQTSVKTDDRGDEYDCGVHRTRVSSSSATKVEDSEVAARRAAAGAAAARSPESMELPSVV